MRSGDVRWSCLLFSLAAACERRPSHEPTSPPVAPATGEPAAAIAAAPELPGCAGRWWPLAAGQAWRWRIERASVDDEGHTRRATAQRDATVRAAPSRDGRARFVIDGWPAPWTDALVEPLTLERDGAAIAEVTRPIAGASPPAAESIDPWLDLGRASPPGPPYREVIAGDRDQPATLVVTWPSMVDDVELTLACGVGPVAFAYHHHGTLEELRAVRVPSRQ